MGKVIKAYKGFNSDMTCRDFQYEEGKEYETEKAEVCETGFHACEYPLDTFRFYGPNRSVYHEVEVSGDIDTDDVKVCGTKIKIGARLDIAGLVKAAIDFTMSRIVSTASKDEPHGASSATGSCGASSATGSCGASSATGFRGASSATGSCGASSATGSCGASSATGSCGASSATGDYGASSATGFRGASSATGSCGASSATGDYGASSATGDYGASSATGFRGASSATGSCGASSATGFRGASSADHPEAVAVAWGYQAKAKGVKGAHLVFADWEGDEDYHWKPEKWTLKGAKMVQVDGEVIKENTWYTMKDGEIIESK